jgi:hypothetical protein
MGEENPLTWQEEEQQHKELLENLGILESDESLNSTYQHALETCGGDTHNAEKIAVYITRVVQEAPRLAEAVDKGSLRADDMYDSTGALTLAGKIAKQFVDSEIQDGGSEDYLRDNNPTFRTLLDTLTAKRVEDGDAAQFAAKIEDPYRSHQKDAKFIAENTPAFSTSEHHFKQYDDLFEDGPTSDFEQLNKAINRESRSIVDQEKERQAEERSKYNEIPKGLEASHEQALKEASDVAVQSRDNLMDTHHEAINRAEGDSITQANQGLRGLARRTAAKITDGPTPGGGLASTDAVHNAALNIAHESGQEAQHAGEYALASEQGTESEKLTTQV